MTQYSGTLLYISQNSKYYPCYNRGIPMKELYQVEVIPLTLLPLTRSPYFTYKSEEVVPFGSLVEVPFGSQTLDGISTACVVKKGSFPSWIKSVIRIKEASLLTAAQITFGEEVAKTNFTPLGRVLRHAIPKVAKKPSEPKVGSEPSLTPKLTKGEATTLERFLKQKKPALWVNEKLENTFVLALAHKLHQKDKQTLILVPEILQLLPLEAEALQYFSPSSIVVLHSHLTPKEYKSGWKRIQSGEATVILSTRQGLFAPFSDLGAIIVTEEQDQGYKQWDMSPRYHARFEAKTLSDIHKAKLLYTTAAPSLESFYEIQKKSLLLLKTFPATPVLSEVSLVNLRLERYRKNFSPISEELRVTLLDTLKAHKQALIIVPQRGIASYSVCAGCKKIFRCPKSAHALRETKSGRYTCPGCDYQTSLFPGCNHCGHLVFWARGIGSERIETELKKLFPYTILARFDGETIRKHKDLTVTYQNLVLGKVDIAIGTHMLEKKFPLPNIALVAMIDADNALSDLDFRGDERFLQTMTKLSLGDKRHPCKLLLQTFEPKHRFLRKLQEKSYQTIALQLLEDRLALGYPPAGTIFALTKNTLTSQGEKKAALALETLQKNFPECFVALPQAKKLTLQKSTSVLLRITQLSPEFESTLLKLAAFYTIDRHPLHFS